MNQDYECVSCTLLLERLETLRANPTEDAVLDLMDEVEGWCAPHRTLAYATLDEAWAAAEAAAPPEALIRMGRTGMTARGWATAYLRGEHLATEFADTLPAALLALADNLRAQTDLELRTAQLRHSSQPVTVPPALPPPAREP